MARDNNTIQQLTQNLRDDEYGVFATAEEAFDADYNTLDLLHQIMDLELPKNPTPEEQRMTIKQFLISQDDRFYPLNDGRTLLIYD